MKLKLTLLLFFICSLNLLAQEFKTPVDYLTYINKEQEIISKSTWKYTTAVAHSKNARKIDNTRKQLIKTIEISKKKISDIKEGYKSDKEYHTLHSNFFDKNQNIELFDFDILYHFYNPLLYHLFSFY